MKDYEPNKPLKALGEYFLTGHDNISGCERVPFNRKVVADFVTEGTKKLASYKTKPEDGRKWFGEWLLARSAEFEEE